MTNRGGAGSEGESLEKPRTSAPARSSSQDERRLPLGLCQIHESFQQRLDGAVNGRTARAGRELREECRRRRKGKASGIRPRVTASEERAILATITQHHCSQVKGVGQLSRTNAKMQSRSPEEGHTARSTGTFVCVSTRPPEVQCTSKARQCLREALLVATSEQSKESEEGRLKDRARRELA